MFSGRVCDGIMEVLYIRPKESTGTEIIEPADQTLKKLFFFPF